jgi:Ribbon-helix-helix protein, copG family
MMVRTQITLDVEAHRRIKHRAAEQGISFAEYVRRALDHDLGEQPRQADPSEIFGLFDSAGADVAAEKDRYVDAAVRGARRSGRG